MWIENLSKWHRHWEPPHQSFEVHTSNKAQLLTFSPLCFLKSVNAGLSFQAISDRQPLKLDLKMPRVLLATDTLSGKPPENKMKGKGINDNIIQLHIMILHT